MPTFCDFFRHSAILHLLRSAKLGPWQNQSSNWRWALLNGYFSLFGIFSLFSLRFFYRTNKGALSFFAHSFPTSLTQKQFAWQTKTIRAKAKLAAALRSWKNFLTSSQTSDNSICLGISRNSRNIAVQCNGWEYQLRYCTNYTNSCTCSLNHLMSESNIRAKVHEHSQNCSITFSRFLLKSSADFQGV